MVEKLQAVGLFMACSYITIIYRKSSVRLENKNCKFEEEEEEE